MRQRLSLFPEPIRKSAISHMLRRLTGDPDKFGLLGEPGLDVYHCLIQVRPGGVPELRDLACECSAEIDDAVAIAVREWPSVEKVEIFLNGVLLKVVSGDALSPRE